MKFFFHEPDRFFSRDLNLLKEVITDKGNEIGEPADLVFMMGYPDLLNTVEEANKKGSHERSVVVLDIGGMGPYVMLKFLRNRMVVDVLRIPHNKEEVELLIKALEADDTTLYQPC